MPPTSPPVLSAHGLLTGVQTGPLDLAATALLAVSAAFYLVAVRRLARRGRRWAPGRTAAFLAGLATVWIAVGSGVAAYDDSSVVVHIVQHLLLMMASPPLLALGHPVTLAAQGSPRAAQVRINRFLRRPVVRAVTHPAPAWALYLAAMAVMLADRTVYDYLVAHPLVHDAGHGLALLAGLLYWQPLVGGDGPHRPSHAARVVSVLANMPFEVLVGLWLCYQTTPVDPINTLGDTNTGGEAFVVGATLLSTLWLAVVVAQWAAFAFREDRRASGRPAAAPAGTAGVPTGWSIPWWVPAGEAGPSR